MNLTEINRWVQEHGPTPAEAISLSVWVAVSFPGSGKGFSFSLPVNNPWRGDPGFVLEEGHASLQLKKRAKCDVCDTFQEFSFYYRLQVKVASLAEPQALPKLKQEHSHWSVCLSSGTSLVAAWIGACLVCSRYRLLAAGMDLLHLHPWGSVFLPPPLHPIQLLWAMPVQSSMGKPVFIHKW